MRYLLLRGALIVVDCVREVTRRSLRSRCANALPTLLRGATDEAMNTPAHVVTEAGVVSCGRKTCAGGVTGLSATLQLRCVKRRVILGACRY